MGTGISVDVRETNEQEMFVRNNLPNAKLAMSVYKSDGHNRFNDAQIKMKLREEYHRRPAKGDNVIPKNLWSNWKKNKK
jgi:hypothetical protein